MRNRRDRVGRESLRTLSPCMRAAEEKTYEAQDSAVQQSLNMGVGVKRRRIHVEDYQSLLQRQDGCRANELWDTVPTDWQPADNAPHQLEPEQPAALNSNKKPRIRPSPIIITPSEYGLSPPRAFPYIVPFPFNHQQQEQRPYFLHHTAPSYPPGCFPPYARDILPQPQYPCYLPNGQPDPHHWVPTGLTRPPFHLMTLPPFTQTHAGMLSNHFYPHHAQMFPPPLTYVPPPVPAAARKAEASYRSNIMHRQAAAVMTQLKNQRAAQQEFEVQRLKAQEQLNPGNDVQEDEVGDRQSNFGEKLRHTSDRNQLPRHSEEEQQHVHNQLLKLWSLNHIEEEEQQRSKEKRRAEEEQLQADWLSTYWCQKHGDDISKEIMTGSDEPPICDLLLPGEDNLSTTPLWTDTELLAAAAAAAATAATDTVHAGSTLFPSAEILCDPLLAAFENAYEQDACQVPAGITEHESGELSRSSSVGGYYDPSCPASATFMSGLDTETFDSYWS
ncbi:hypothetical protein CEUSTIGMA_g3725.t1 [Chlamydomonas eustigma]|uniref:Uncharacterized protein n=1 Tax=Chlamydomonas eustigma TaxID=1157962 RepID=A0A250X0K0_9CHLO|nr:hypothetical protein CEUSTIGMA_g3725.t1 [Chlamydomonas eustigma]|eukprot:GAX76280.1 hypothetical protein CEUSTIGMA_g3725.t1 [Chlamydomonas eustigma]